MEPSTEKPLRIAAVGDLHCKETSHGQLRQLFARIPEEADVFCLCGDLTDRGLPAEAAVLLEELAALPIPKVAVLGNHDHESGRAEELTALLGRGGITVLDGTVCELGGVGFTGVKGFAGGYGAHMVQAWGEGALKQFVMAAVEEALKLENALSRLETARKVVLMHYAPIKETLTGESPEILAFLGCSRLVEPLEMFRADVVFHGHAHHGIPEGATPAGVKVYNVALPLLRRTMERAYRVVAI